tara:strand:- start:820 stop:1062 length:243 start_codon:yes stop_codon:yes gene_type:complete
VVVDYKPFKLYNNTKENIMIKEALTKKLEGDIEVAKADLRIFLAQPIGVAEHIDYVVTAEKKLDALAHAEDKLESLKKLG